MIKNGIATFLVALLFACSGPSKLSNVNLAYKYSAGLSFVFPQYHTVHGSRDTARLLFEFEADDILYLESDSGVFGSYALSYSVYRDMESKAIVDSGVSYFSCKKLEGVGGIIRGALNLYAPDSFNYVLRVDFIDSHRRQSVTDIVYLDRTGIQNPGNFLLIDSYTNTPLVRHFSDRNVSVRISLQGASDQKRVFMRYFKANYPIADPPFSDEPQPVLSYVANESYLIDIGGTDPIPLDKPGMYHFQFDTLVPEGYTFHVFDEDFPRLTHVGGLLESVRYLTTREEFARINSSKNIKASVDEFWLSKAGNRERAKELIKSYYGRVQTANRLFTSYMEGWKTDRGLIYVIFGTPGTVYRGNDSETWLYSQTAGQPTLSFVFEKKKNPFTSNDFMLRRSIYYDLPWYRAVETWRDGRIYNDSY
ncbi:MAG: GWxTD domain-containing protein [Bacteroidota bacterium]